MPWPFHFAIIPAPGDVDDLASIPLGWEPMRSRVIEPAEQDPRLSGKISTKGIEGRVFDWKEMDEQTWGYLVQLAGGAGSSNPVLVRCPIHYNASGVPKFGDYSGILYCPKGGDHDEASVYQRKNVTLRIVEMTLIRISP